MAGGGGSGSGSSSAAAEEFVDHYEVLCLPSGEEGAKLSLDQIDKAYKAQSRLRHPDKRPDDPDATADFQKLRASYDYLRDEPSRRALDARLRSRRDRVLRDSALDAKRRKLASDLDERERAAAASPDGAVDPVERALRQERVVAAKLKRELHEFQADKNSRRAAMSSTSTSGKEKREGSMEKGKVVMEKEKMLKVSWERSFGDYTAAKLKEILGRFGEVEDVVIRSKKSKNRGSAIVVMSSKEAAVAATRHMNGVISNPLLVLPLEGASLSSSEQIPEIHEPKANVVGAAFNDYEASVLKKLQEASKKRDVQ